MVWRSLLLCGRCCFALCAGAVGALPAAADGGGSPSAPSESLPAADSGPGEHGDYHARARSEPDAADDPSAASTTLQLEGRVSRPTALAEVLREAPGAQVARTGGPTEFSSVALRGADPNETLLLLDDVPLVAPDGGAFDLSSLPAELFSQVEVYRGGAPVWLNAGAIGGVVRLRPRLDVESRASAAIGGWSFGSWQLDASGSVVRESGLAARSIAVVRGSRGDYPYLDDRGTRLDPSDDIERVRQNADFSDATGLLDLELPLAAGRLHALVLASGRSGGFPGPASQPTPKIHRQSTRVLSALSYTLGDAKARLSLVASGAYSRERYTDLFGQLGTSKRTASDDQGLRAFARAAGELALRDWLSATLSLGYSLDALLPENPLSRLPLDPSTRHDLAGAFELDAHGQLGSVRFGLRPSARLEWSQTSLDTQTRSSQPLQLDHDLTSPTFRLAAWVEPLPALGLQASAATGTRLPTVFELFGDRGLVLPSPQLEPVRSTTFDIGGTLRARGGWLRGQLELHGFHQQRRDSIAMFRTAQWQLAHENLAAVSQWGLEAGGSAWLGETFGVHGALTQLYTRTALDKRLPFRPQTQLYTRPEINLRVRASALSSLRAGAELSFRSFAYVDRANLAYVGACTKLTLMAAVGLWRDVLRIEARLDDVGDARCSDWVGYPLPGRMLFFTLRYEESFDETA